MDRQDSLIIRGRKNCHRIFTLSGGKFRLFTTHEDDFLPNLSALFSNLNARTVIRQGAQSALAFVLVLLMLVQQALALPAGWEVVSGDVTFQVDGSTLNVHSSSSQAIVNYQSFNIAGGETVNFFLLNSTASILNRVIGGGPSSIMGNLNSNGTVLLSNNAGINIGATANINTGSFIASSLNIADQDYLSGNWAFSRNGDNPAAVINEGSISAMPGGYVVLAGSAVENSGNIFVPDGTVHLAAGDKIRVNVSDTQAVEVIIDEALLAKVDEVQHAISNSGTIESKTIELQTELAENLYSRVVNNDGVIRAVTATEEGGVIRLRGHSADQQAIVENSGTLDASGSELNPDGGLVSLHADWLIQSGNILSEGYEGGTGGYVELSSTQGTALTSDSYTSVKGAGENSNAGEMLIWSDKNTYFRNGAVIDVSGGSVSGNAGFVEVSGLETVYFQGQARGHATEGYERGRILIDPVDIIIDNAGGSPDPADCVGCVDVAFADGGALETYDPQAGGSFDGFGDIWLQATNDIIVNSAFDTSVATGNANVSLTLEANNDITINAPLTTNNAAIRLWADADGNNSGTLTINDTVSSNGGEIQLMGSQIDINATVDIGDPGVQTWLYIGSFASKDIHVGGSVDNADSAAVLDISQAEINRINSGANVSVNIGAVNVGGSGAITVNEDFTIGPNIGGWFDLASDISVTIDGAITSNANVYLDSLAIDINNTIDVGPARSIWLTGWGNDITVGGSVDNADGPGVMDISKAELDRLNAGDVIIGAYWAVGDVSVNENLTLNGVYDLKLESANNILINGSLDTAGRNLILNADGDLDASGDVGINASIATGGGSLLIEGEYLNINSGTITTSGGSLTLNSREISGVSDVTIANGSIVDTGGGNITMSGDDLFLNGTIQNAGLIQADFSDEIIMSSTGSITNSNGTTLNARRHAVIGGSISLNNATLTLDGDFNDDGNGNLTIGSTGTVNTGGGALFMSGNNIFMNGAINTNGGAITSVTDTNSSGTGRFDTGAGSSILTNGGSWTATGDAIHIDGNGGGNSFSTINLGGGTFTANMTDYIQIGYTTTEFADIDAGAIDWTATNYIEINHTNTTINTSGPGGISMATDGNFTTNGTITTNGPNMTLIADNNGSNAGNLVINNVLTSNGGNIHLEGSQMDINQSVNAGTGNVTLRRASNKTTQIGGAVDNADTAGILDISSQELARITADTLLIRGGGDIDIIGNLDVSGAGAGAYNLDFGNSGRFDAAGQTLTLGDKTMTVNMTWIDDTGSIVGGAGDITLNSLAWIKVNGDISSTTGNITLLSNADADGTINPADWESIDLNANITSTGGIIDLTAMREGEITWQSGRITGPTVNLTTDLSGNMGTVANPIQTDAGVLTVTNTGTGDVNIIELNDVDLAASVSGGGFDLLAGGSIDILGDLTVTGTASIITNGLNDSFISQADGTTITADILTVQTTGAGTNNGITLDDLTVGTTLNPITTVADNSNITFTGTVSTPSSFVVNTAGDNSSILFNAGAFAHIDNLVDWDTSGAGSNIIIDGFLQADRFGTAMDLTTQDGNITVNGTVRTDAPGGNMLMTTNGVDNDITINGTVFSARDLNLTTNANDSDIIFTAAADVTLGDDLRLRTFGDNAGISITDSAITVTDAILITTDGLGSNITISTANPLIFGDQVDRGGGVDGGGEGFTISTAGVDSDISITADITTNINSPTISTTGNQSSITYAGNFTSQKAGQNVTITTAGLTDSAITHSAGTISVNGATLNISTAGTFSGITVDSITASSLNGTGTLSTGQDNSAITITGTVNIGDQDFTVSTTGLNSGITLAAGSDIAPARDLSLTTTGDNSGITLAGRVDVGRNYAINTAGADSDITFANTSDYTASGITALSLTSTDGPNSHIFVDGNFTGSSANFTQFETQDGRIDITGTVTNPDLGNLFFTTNGIDNDITVTGTVVSDRDLSLTTNGNNSDIIFTATADVTLGDDLRLRTFGDNAGISITGSAITVTDAILITTDGLGSNITISTANPLIFGDQVDRGGGVDGGGEGFTISTAGADSDISITADITTNINSPTISTAGNQSSITYAGNFTSQKAGQNVTITTAGLTDSAITHSAGTITANGSTLNISTAGTFSGITVDSITANSLNGTGTLSTAQNDSPITITGDLNINDADLTVSTTGANSGITFTNTSSANITDNITISTGGATSDITLDGNLTSNAFGTSMDIDTVDGNISIGGSLTAITGQVDITALDGSITLSGSASSGSANVFFTTSGVDNDISITGTVTASRDIRAITNNADSDIDLNGATITAGDDLRLVTNGNNANITITDGNIAYTDATEITTAGDGSNITISSVNPYTMGDQVDRGGGVDGGGEGFTISTAGIDSDISITADITTNVDSPTISTAGNQSSITYAGNFTSQRAGRVPPSPPPGWTVTLSTTAA